MGVPNSKNREIRGIMQHATRGMPTSIHTVDLAHAATRIHTVDLVKSALIRDSDTHAKRETSQTTHLSPNFC